MKKRSVHIAVDPMFRQAFRIQSAKRGTKMVDFSRELAKKWLEQEETGEKKNAFNFKI